MNQSTQKTEVSNEKKLKYLRIRKTQVVDRTGHEQATSNFQNGYKVKDYKPEVYQDIPRLMLGALCAPWQKKVEILGFRRPPVTIPIPIIGGIK